VLGGDEKFTQNFKSEDLRARKPHDSHTRRWEINIIFQRRVALVDDLICRGSLGGPTHRQLMCYAVIFLQTSLQRYVSTLQDHHQVDSLTSLSHSNAFLAHCSKTWLKLPRIV
jgi:hypothetical protein